MITFGIMTPTVAVIILVIALIIFGPGKLPELGKGLGKGIKEFKTAADDAKEAVNIKPELQEAVSTKTEEAKES